jgi:hypothetical protein
MSTARVLPLALLLAGLAGCGPKIQDGPGVIGPEGNGAPEGPGAEGEHAGSSVGELEKRLGDLTKRRDASMGTAMSDVDTCEDLCDLATSICEVAKRLEVIADRNAGNESYQVLKRQAQLECRDAKESCTNCVSGFESQPPEEPDAIEPPAEEGQ